MVAAAPTLLFAANLIVIAIDYAAEKIAAIRGELSK